MIDRTAAPLDVLLVEDNPADARLVSEYLRESPTPVTVTHAQRLEHAVGHLRRQGFHMVLLDLSLPDSRGFETFQRAHAAAPEAPIIVLTGLDDEEMAVRAVREGAQDYLVKGKVDAPLLSHSIRYAIERKRAERDLHEREERFRQIAENIHEVFFILDSTYSETLYISPAYEQIWGRTCQSLYNDPRSFLEGVVEEDRALLLAHMAQAQGGQEPGELEFRVLRPDGEMVWVLSQATPIRNARGDVYRIAGVALDITRRIDAEQAVRSSERRLRTLFETVNLIVLGLDQTGRVDYVNPFFLRLGGYALEDVLGRSWIDHFLPPAQREQLRTTFAELLESERHTHYRNSILTKAGQERMISWHNTVVYDTDGQPAGTLSIGEDVTQHELLEEQFRQAQKMEAVGRLAGGVAHDFNNVLTVITGHSELLLSALPLEDQNRADAEAIGKAADSAASLTRQLLAFSRQQVVEPAIININDVVRPDEKMLRRLIGDDVRLVTTLAPDLDPVRADVGQIQQVIMNLAVNARDAMPRGGILTIETANVDLSEEYAREHLGDRTGPHVLLAVSDTGTGMDQATQARIFEPFFTTKEAGVGTGLGLATVYGIVKQSDGLIWVYSAPGSGTSFKIYLRRAVGPATEAAPTTAAAAPGGDETVLLVDDAAAVRAVAHRVLERLGYAVIEAPDPNVALAVAARHPGTIDLLLTDVVMPDMSGLELVDRVRDIRPGIKALLMSGYTDNAIARAGVVEPGTPYLQKPFTPDGLARKVRQVLDAQTT